MKIARIMVFGIVVLMLSVIGGCSGSKDVGPEKTPFIGGENGMIMSFISGAPPEEIFDDSQSPFGIMIKLKNMGEDDVETTDGYVEVIGINAKDFNKGSQADLKTNIPDDIERAKKTFEGKVLDGGSAIAEFTDLMYTPDIAGNKEARIRASTCYNYKTRATSLICVKKDLLKNMNTKEICEVSGKKTIHNSGGPIHITNFEQAPMGNDKIQLTIDIDHVGETNDMFYKLGTDCDDTPTNMDRFKVFLKVTSDVDGEKAECSGITGGTDLSEGYITLYNKEPRRIVCTLDVSSVDSVYEDSFDVELDYRYEQFIEKTLLIKDVSGET